jgi:hypothetical protein
MMRMTKKKQRKSPKPPAVFAVPAVVQTNPYSPLYEHRADGVS